MFLFSDGSVKGVNSAVSFTTLTRLAVRNDGLPVPDDY
jgi:hypothetical protein